MVATTVLKGGYPAVRPSSLSMEGAFFDNRSEGVGDWEEDFGQVYSTTLESMAALKKSSSLPL